MREGAVIRLSKPAFRCRAIFTEFCLFLGFMRSGEKNVALFLRLDKFRFAVREASVSRHNGEPIK